MLACCWPCHLYKSGVQRLKVALVLTVLKVAEFESFVFDKFSFECIRFGYRVVGKGLSILTTKECIALQLILLHS